MWSKKWNTRNNLHIADNFRPFTKKHHKYHSLYQNGSP